MFDLKHLFASTKAKILELFLDKHYKILFAIGLHRILHQLRDASCNDSSIHLKNMSNNNCWICFEKQRLLKEAIEEYEKKISKNLENSSSLSLESNWSSITKWIDSDKSENFNCVYPDFIPNVKNEANEKENAALWENLYSQIKNNLRQCINDCTTLLSHGSQKCDVKCCRFPVKTNLTMQQLLTRFPAHFINVISSNENSNLVAVEVCNKCLKQISFENCQNVGENQQSLHCVCRLIKHCAFEAGKENTCKYSDIVFETKKQSFQPALCSNNQSKRIKITILHCGKKSFTKNQLKPVIPSIKSAFSAKPFGHGSMNYGHSVQSVCTDELFPPLKSSRFHANTIGSDDGGSTAVFVSNPVLPVTRAFPLYPRTLNKMDILKVANKFFISNEMNKQKINLEDSMLETKANCLSQTLPATTSPKLINNTEKPKLLSTHLNKINFISAKLLPVVSTHSSLSKGRFIKVCSNVKSVNGKPLSTNSFQIIPRLKESVKQQNETNKYSASVKAVKQQTSSKRKSQSNNDEGNSNVKKFKTENTRKSSTTKRNNLSSKFTKNRSTSFNRTQKLSITSSTVKGNSFTVKSKCEDSFTKQRPAVKSPNKQKTLDKVPMKTVVRNYIARAAQNSFTSTSNDKTKQLSRSKQRGLKNLIPVPYEAHYLCIHETLAKKGWKAYWYNKCRCARPLKKVPIPKLRRSPRKHVYAPIVDDFSLFYGRAKAFTKLTKTVQSSNFTKEHLQKCVSFDQFTKSSSTEKLDLSPAVLIAAKLNINVDAMSLNEERLKPSTYKSEIENKMCNSVFSKDGFQMQILDEKKLTTALNQLNISILNKSVITPSTCVESKPLQKTITSPDSSKRTKIKKSHEKEAKTSETTCSTRFAQACVQVYKSTNKASNIQVVQQLEKEPSLPNLTVVSDEQKSRNDKVKKVAELCLMRLKTSFEKPTDKNGTTKPENIFQTFIFSQYFTEVDKNPEFMDLINVNSLLLKEYPDLFSKAKEIAETKQLLKNDLLNVPCDQSLSSKSSQSVDDIDCIWSFGKSYNQLCEKSDFSKKLKQTKAQFTKKSITKKSDIGLMDDLAFKRMLNKFLQSRPNHTLYCRRSRRPRAVIPEKWRSEQKTKSKEDNAVHTGLEPYLIPCDIPKSSVSTVVRTLENDWGEEENFDAFAGFIDCNFTMTLTSEIVKFAVTALKENSEMFTFSSKPKDGKNTVLLISRKLIVDSSDKKINSLNKQSTFDSASSVVRYEQENSTACDSNKILLKLKKTGEVLGSAIYSVPKVSPVSSSAECRGLASGEEGNNILNNRVNADYSLTAVRSTEVSSYNYVNREETFPRFNDGTETLKNMEGQNVSKFWDSPQVITNSPISNQLSFHGLDKSDLVHNEKFGTDSNSEIYSDSEIECDLLHSTALEESIADDFSNDMWKLSYENNCEHLENLTYVENNNDLLRVVNWDGKLEGKDDLEELLASINENSFEVLEKCLVYDHKFSLSPSTFKKLCNDAKKPCYSFNHDILVDTESCFNKKPTSMHDAFQNSFSTLDSPEVVRGNSHCKSSDHNSTSALPPPLQCFSDSEAIEQSTTVMNSSSPKSETSLESPIANSMIKSCNVLLKPLEGMLQDLRKSSNGGKAHRTHKNTSTPRSPFTESSARELNRLLKNRALNGAYWNSMSSDIFLSGNSSTRWLFRDRKKRKANDEDSIVFDNLTEDNDTTEEIVYRSSEVQYPKRKNRRNEIYLRPSRTDLLCQIQTAKRKPCFSFTKFLRPSLELVSTDDNRLKDRPIRDLFLSCVNIDKVYSWILESTVSHPRSLHFSTILVRKPNGSRKSYKNSTRGDDGNAINQESIDGSSPKKSSKKDPHRNSFKFFQTEEFSALRRALFRQRHPKYKGNLYNEDDSKPSFVPSSVLSCNHHLKLQRVDAQKARLRDSPTITPDIILRRKSSSVVAKKLQKVLTSRDLLRHKHTKFRPSSKFHINSSSSKRYNIKNVKSIASSKGKRPMLPGSVIPPQSSYSNSIHRQISVSSRGRTIKPSIRSRSISYEFPPKKKRRLSSSLKPALVSSATSVTFRGRGRFANKHSTSGKYIKHLLETGAYTSS